MAAPTAEERDRARGELPTKGGQAVETGKAGKIRVFGPGTTKSLTLTLEPGHYALLRALLPVPAVDR